MRLNISVPDELAEQVRARDLPISAICQEALRTAVDQAQKKEQIMTDLDTVVARLRATQDDAREEQRTEGHELGVLWAKEYATADDLARVAMSDRLTYERGLGGTVNVSVFEFYEVVDHNLNEEYADEHTEGFIDGAREVWEAVKNLI